MTTDYLTELKSTVLADERVESCKGKKDSLREQVAAFRTRKSELEASIAQEKAHAADLEARRGESLVKGGGDYTQFMAGLRESRSRVHDMADEIQAVEQATKTTQEQLMLANRQLNDALESCCRAKLPICENRITQLLGQIADEIDAWQETWEQLFVNYCGSGFSCGNPANMPTAKHPRLDTRYSCLFRLLSAEERIEKMRAAETR